MFCHNLSIYSKKTFASNLEPTYHFFCQSCNNNLENLEDVEHCPNCEAEINLNSTSGKNYFMSIPISSQVNQILSNHIEDLLSTEVTLNRSTDYIFDIFDGELYKNIVKNFNGRRLITLTFNTDGVKIFKSIRKGSFWPLQFVINELDPSVRYKPENIVVCGFWFGGNPIMELFFKPFVQEIIAINKTGLTLQISDQKFTILPLIATLDTVAKDKLQNKTQFNGYSSCSYCLHPGTLIRNQIRYFIFI